MRIIDQRTTRTTTEIEQVFADYWHDVDDNAGLTAAEFYTEDCRLEVAGTPIEGRAGVADFYRRRRERGIRTTRHVNTNFQVFPEGEDLARVSFALLVYAWDGPAPILGHSAPSSLMQSHAELVRGADGYWRIRRMGGQALFVGDEPHTVSVLLKTER